LAHDVTYETRGRAPRQPRKRFYLLLGAGLCAANIAVFAYHGDPRSKAAALRAVAAAPTPAPVARPSAAPAAGDAPQAWAPNPNAGSRMPGLVQKVVTVALRPGNTVGQALANAGLAGAEVTAAINALQKQVDLRRLRPGQVLKARQDQAGALVSLDLRKSPVDQVRAEREGGAWQAQRLDVAVATVTGRVHGVVQNSLWEAMTAIHEDPRLAMDVADIFSWDIDFYSEVYPGDTFSLLLEKRFTQGKFVEYGAILAAEFTSAGVVHRAFLHRNAAEPAAAVAYYDAQGRSLRKQLLKSPLKYAHVTSHFGMRVHPVLGYSRAHNGIDYSAPPGTPVWAVADGHVLRAGWVGGYGKLIELRHANGFVSQYGHLSQINVRGGQHVTQKDVIGLTGSTGLSTGPHLHYGLMKSGGYVDPAKQKFEPGKPLLGTELQEFLKEASQLLERLRETPVASAAEQASAARG
jgi:murein DD-endopeptidase MepM/ murein hydrolase activator NlpD